MSNVATNKLLLFEQIKGGKDTYTAVNNIKPIINDLIQKDFNISGIITFDSEISIAANAYTSESDKYVYYYDFSSHVNQYVHTISNITADAYHVYISFPETPVVSDIIEDVIITDNSKLKFIFNSNPAVAISGIQVYLVRHELSEIIRYHTHSIEDIQFDNTNTAAQNSNLYDLLISDVMANLPILTFDLTGIAYTANGTDSSKLSLQNLTEIIPTDVFTDFECKKAYINGVTKYNVTDNLTTDGTVTVAYNLANAHEKFELVLANKKLLDIIND